MWFELLMLWWFIGTTAILDGLLRGIIALGEEFDYGQD